MGDVSPKKASGDAVIAAILDKHELHGLQELALAPLSQSFRFCSDISLAHPATDVRAARGPNSPENRSDSVTLLPAPSPSTRCSASSFTPGLRGLQIKHLGSSISVTCQIAGDNPGCRISTVLPTANGRLSISRTLVTAEFHSGQRSTSDITLNTRSGGA